MVRAHLRSIYPPIIIIIFLNKEKSGGADAGSLLSRVQQTLPKGKKKIIINTERRKKKPQYQKKKNINNNRPEPKSLRCYGKGRGVRRGGEAQLSAAQSAAAPQPRCLSSLCAQLRAAPPRPAPPAQGGAERRHSASGGARGACAESRSFRSLPPARRAIGCARGGMQMRRGANWRKGVGGGGLAGDAHAALRSAPGRRCGGAGRAAEGEPSAAPLPEDAPPSIFFVPPRPSWCCRRLSG